jgi:hypothetical protein
MKFEYYHYLGNDEHWKYEFKSTKEFFVRANICSAGEDIVGLRLMFFVVVIIDNF